MTHVTLTINGDTLMDGDLGEWSTEPAAITDLKAKPAQPWAIPTLQAIAAAAIAQKDTHIDVRTHADGWGMDVRASCHRPTRMAL